MAPRPRSDPASPSLLARADDAARRAPHGRSAPEGWLVVAMAGLLFVLLAVTFQARWLEWGGLVGAGMTVGFLALLPVFAGARRRHERVHPRGHARRGTVAAVWGTSVALAGGFLWRSGLVQVAAPVWLTTLVALVAVAPLAWLGLGLVRRPR